MDLLFGLGLSTSAAPDADPLAEALAAERLGYDFVSASDHPCGTHPTYETWTMLTWIAARTERVHILTRVLGVPYRSPAMVAKMAESFDRLSGGRLILGLGGGSADHEFRAFGLGVPTPREKVVGMEEAVRIIRGLWTEQAFTFEGSRFHTDAADIEPKPDRRIPIWLGTFGPKALAVTGELADGWIPSLGYAPPDEAVGMRDRLRRAAEAAGRDPGSITCAYNMGVNVGDDAVADDGSTIAGPVDEIVKRLLSFVELGFNAFNFIPDGPDWNEQVERVAQEVIPAVRAAV